MLLVRDPARYSPSACCVVISYYTRGDFHKTLLSTLERLSRIYPEAPSYITQRNESCLTDEKLRDLVATLVMRDWYKIGLKRESKFIAALTLDILH